ncbi:MAG: DUF222 domain-containing protein [Acidimicrobiia bacterium]|nr:DUF222 domain-containing protein [Acidimicrobiia bacterium]
MFMVQEHMSSLLGRNRNGRHVPRDFTPGDDAIGRIGAALGELRQARIGPMYRDQATRAAQMLGEIRSMVSSLLCDVAHQIEADHGGSGVDAGEVLRQEARLPQRESKKMAKVARRLQEMPKVRERFANGQITVDHVNALANAAEKVGTEAVNGDDRLLEAADQLLPDSFDRHTRRWSNQKLIERGVDPLERQRRAREAKLWVDKETGLGILMAKVPRPQFEHLRQAIDHHYMSQLRQDSAGGQDPNLVRSPKQRVADAVFELLTNRNAQTGEPVAGTVGIKAKASTQLILVAPLGVVDGTDPQGVCEIIGVGPVPPSVLTTLSADTEVAGMIFDRAGRPLWLGRNQRLANAPQRLAVAIRDRGCFACGAPMHRCELHHIQEWQRDRGPTDIDNLVAVCRRHHKWLETNNLAVQRTTNGYQTRPRPP